MSATPSGRPRRFDGSIGTGSAAELIDQARRLEAQGVDTIWAAQLHQTPFVPLAAVAGATQRVQLGTAIALAFTRSPMETALTALDMDRITDGRFKLGLGAGVKRLNEQWHNVTDFGRPAPHVKEAVEVVRLLIERGARGGAVHYRGRYYQVDLRDWQPMYEPRPLPHPDLRRGRGRSDGARRGRRRRRLAWPHRLVPALAARRDRSQRRLGPTTLRRSRADFDLAVSHPGLHLRQRSPGPPRRRYRRRLLRLDAHLPPDLRVARLRLGS